ncbi:hypothetical protein H0H81_008485 [Sphagnurus paluster]|uniref:PNPLA domain-containing protein n=1 Tax=Sphagnurus paluster TaxID=117069 RepID=A0A9P7GLG8_9AGAR|nr:hypothetical protein H0H81_008485 [Sphagnurus paluster]
MSDAASVDSGYSGPVRLLALDGGGIRGLSGLVILREIMKRIEAERGLGTTPRPCDYFDMIGGSGTGGLLAIMLGRLGMSVDEAIGAYVEFAKTVFSDRKWFFKNETFKATVLERVIKKIIRDKEEDPEARMKTDKPTTNCKTFVCAMSAVNLAAPRIFRSYDVKENQTYNCKIWEAARATSAASSFFKSIDIGQEGLKERFIDGGLRCNNPVQQVRDEAHLVYGKGCEVACIVSIGAGHPNVIALRKPSAFQRILPTGLIKVLEGIAADCESIAEGFEKEYTDKKPRVYFRLNVQQGLQNVSLAEWDKLSEVKTHTLQYTAETKVGKHIDHLKELLTAGALLESVTRDDELI